MDKQMDVKLKTPCVAQVQPVISNFHMPYSGSNGQNSMNFNGNEQNIRNNHNNGIFGLENSMNGMHMKNRNLQNQQPISNRFENNKLGNFGNAKPVSPNGQNNLPMRNFSGGSKSGVATWSKTGFV